MVDQRKPRTPPAVYPLPLPRAWPIPLIARIYRFLISFISRLLLHRSPDPLPPVPCVPENSDPSLHPSSPNPSLPSLQHDASRGGPRRGDRAHDILALPDGHDRVPASARQGDDQVLQRQEDREDREGQPDLRLDQEERDWERSLGYVRAYGGYAHGAGDGG